MQVIHHAAQLIDAHLVAHALEHAGIPAFVLGQALLGGIGELPAGGLLRVAVADIDVARAAPVVAALGLDRGPAAPIVEDDGLPGAVPA